MKFILTAAALVATISAQAVTIPGCAVPCVNAGLPQNCNLDPKCICSSASFINAISCCVATACSVADQNATLAYAHTICDPVGAGTTLPKSASCAGGSSTNSTSSAAASASSAASSASHSASSVASSASSAASTAAASASASTSRASASASASASGNAAPVGYAVAQGASVLGAGLLGLFALL